MKNGNLSHEIQDALNELAPVLWPHAQVCSFSLHPLYGVGVTQDSIQKLPFVFGNSFVEKMKLGWRYFRKLKWLNKDPFSLKAILPKDAIIFFRSNKGGLLVVSHEQNLALKLFFTEEAKSLLEDEIKTLHFLGSTSFAPYTANLVKHGTSKNGGRWVATTFCENSHPLNLEADHDRYLLNHMDQMVMPIMTHFYKAYRVDALDLGQWLKLAHERAQKLNFMEDVKPLFKIIEKESLRFPMYKVLKGQIHHDIHAGNILRDEKRVVIIDWEGSTQGLILIDVFDFLRRVVTHQKSFWHFLGSNVSAPQEVVGIFKFYRQWAQENFEVEIPDGSERLTLFVYVLERIFLLGEKRNINRLKDKSSFEYKAYQTSLNL